MIDLVHIKVLAGSGGDGAVSFYKLKNMRYGRPDGGDGGDGGSIFLEAVDDLFDLGSYRGRNLWKAEAGKKGGESGKTGESGSELVLKVPVGTVATITAFQHVYSFDLKDVGQKVLLAQGGRGGRGNSHVRFIRDKKGQKPDHWDAYNQVHPGQKGEEKEVVLELKYLAQIGLIGLPNAGKSSLLSVLTNAHPKIADYPFTTIEPNIGIFNPGVQTHFHPWGVGGVVIADIPGLVEGASKGRGLGFNFLRHIERTSILVHVVDVSGENPLSAYKTVRDELKFYGRDLEKKKEIVVLNKIDLLDKVKLKKVVTSFKKLKPLLVSCQSGEGLESLRKTLISSVSKI
ncbi:GTPase ObgE [Candidatus Gottesmanbacteria bacterium]|nr:GTPase ObgE [Candidatus Gottesmanbacteria bacterium]